MEFLYIAESSQDPYGMLMKLKYELSYEDVYDILEFMEAQKFYQIERDRISRNENR